jgi:GrpB-like predicted nucleotidyltransferase (UPF0157 family)
MRNEMLQEKIDRVTAEVVKVVEYDPGWVGLFESEREHLFECLPGDMVVRIEHFGSTAVAGLAAKPVVDMVIEIDDAERGKVLIPEILEPQGYDCFWRPIGDEDVPPYYTWCIKRDGCGVRTHHLHFVEVGFKEDELRFRDILRDDPDTAQQYGELKLRLSKQYYNDRNAYTDAKGDFIRGILKTGM